MKFTPLSWAMGLAIATSGIANAAQSTRHDVLALEDVFNLEYANQIDISDDGDTVYFVRNRMDIKSDRKFSNIWQVSTDNKQLQPVTSGVHQDFAPVLSPDGSRLAFISTRDGSAQLYVKWLNTGAVSKISNLTQSPSKPTWTPDGKA